MLRFTIRCLQRGRNRVTVPGSDFRHHPSLIWLEHRGNPKTLKPIKSPCSGLHNAAWQAHTEGHGHQEGARQKASIHWSRGCNSVPGSRVAPLPTWLPSPAASLFLCPVLPYSFGSLCSAQTSEASQNPGGCLAVCPGTTQVGNQDLQGGSPGTLLVKSED